MPPTALETVIALDSAEPVRYVAPGPLLVIDGSCDERTPRLYAWCLFVAAGQPERLTAHGTTNGSVYNHGLNGRTLGAVAFFERALLSEEPEAQVRRVL